MSRPHPSLRTHVHFCATCDAVARWACACGEDAEGVLQCELCVPPENCDSSEGPFGLWTPFAWLCSPELRHVQRWYLATEAEFPEEGAASRGLQAGTPVITFPGETTSACFWIGGNPLSLERPLRLTIVYAYEGDSMASPIFEVQVSSPPMPPEQSSIGYGRAHGVQGEVRGLEIDVLWPPLGADKRFRLFICRRPGRGIWHVYGVGMHSV